MKDIEKKLRGISARDHLEPICVTKRVTDACMKKRLKKTNTFVGKLVGVLPKLFLCEMMVAQIKVARGKLGRRDGFERYKGFALIGWGSRWLVREERYF